MDLRDGNSQRIVEAWETYRALVSERDRLRVERDESRAECLQLRAQMDVATAALLVRR